MNTEKIISLINNPQTIASADVTALDNILLKHPYFQIGQLLLAKGLLNTDSIRYNRQLKKAAAYCLDRKKLFSLITLNKISENEKLRISELLGENLNQAEIFYIKTRFGLKNIQIGSGILAVLCLLKTCEKVNVFGWDAFVDDDFGESFSKQAENLWNSESWVNDFTRFSAIVFNWIYGNRLHEEFKDLNRLRIHGRITETFNKSWVKKNLFRVIYKNSA